MLNDLAKNIILWIVIAVVLLGRVGCVNIMTLWAFRPYYNRKFLATR